MIKDEAGHLDTKIAFTDILFYREGCWLAASAQETQITQQ